MQSHRSCCRCCCSSWSCSSCWSWELRAHALQPGRASIDHGATVRGCGGGGGGGGGGGHGPPYAVRARPAALRAAAGRRPPAAPDAAFLRLRQPAAAPAPRALPRYRRAPLRRTRGGWRPRDGGLPGRRLGAHPGGAPARSRRRPGAGRPVGRLALRSVRAGGRGDGRGLRLAALGRASGAGGRGCETALRLRGQLGERTQRAAGELPNPGDRAALCASHGPPAGT